MTQPDVSVVIPTHNRRPLLATTLACVLAQRGVAMEVVVVDDGSTDDTAAWLASLNDDRVTVIRHERPTGVARARNRGIAEARGAHIAFLDDDDLWAPDKLQRQLAALRQDEGVWACSNVAVIDDSLTVQSVEAMASGQQIAADLVHHNAVPAGSSNVIATAEAVRRAGAFDEQLRHFADWDLWVKLLRIAPPVTVAEPDVAYRVHGGNASSTSRDALAECKVVGARSADLRDNQPIDDLWVLRWIGWWSVLAGRRRDAVWAYATAVRRGDARSLGRLAVAVAGPRLASRALARPVDPALAAEAQAWLSALPHPEPGGT